MLPFEIFDGACHQMDGLRTLETFRDNKHTGDHHEVCVADIAQNIFRANAAGQQEENDADTTHSTDGELVPDIACNHNSTDCKANDH